MGLGGLAPEGLLPSSFPPVQYKASPPHFRRRKQIANVVDSEDDDEDQDAEGSTDMEAIRSQKRLKRKDPKAESDSWNWNESDRTIETFNDVDREDPMKIIGVLLRARLQALMLTNIRMALPRSIVSLIHSTGVLHH